MTTIPEPNVPLGVQTIAKIRADKLLDRVQAIHQGLRTRVIKMILAAERCWCETPDKDSWAVLAIVEDNPENNKDIKNIVSDYGYKIETSAAFDAYGSDKTQFTGVAFYITM